jgi:hypothetical protein
MPPGILAAWLHREAHSYLAAVRHLNGVDPHELIGPRYSLLAYALELALKAFLAAKGYDRPALRTIGNDLNDAHAAATAEGMTLTDERISTLVRLITPGLAEHRLGYAGTRSLELPNSEEARELIEELLRQISDAVESARIRARLELLASGVAYDPEL